MSTRGHLQSNNDKGYQHDQQSVDEHKERLTTSNKEDQALEMAMVGSVSRAKGSNSYSGSRQTQDHDERSEISNTNSRSVSGEVSLASSHVSETSLQHPHSSKDANKQAKSLQEDDSKPVPSSPLVTPPMLSKKSPNSPRANIKCPSVLPPAALPHGFHVDPAMLQPNSDQNSSGRSAPPLGGRLVVDGHGASHLNLSPSNRSPGKPRGVPHVYHDFSHASGPGPSYVRKKTGGVSQPFPEKLHEMLDSESNDDPSSAIVSWLPHGRAFIVRRPKEFTSEILPKYFRQTKLTSFQRQLNLYGFRRITQGADAGSYYHELFLQGRSSLSQRMVRQKVKGTGHKQPADVSSEPNFYSMPAVEPEDRSEMFGARYKPSIASRNSISGLRNTQHEQENAPGAEPDDNNLDAKSDDSPGSSSVQGAASLLHGFASSFGQGTAFLGPAANSGQGQTQHVASLGPRHAQRQSPASSFLPRNS